MGWEFGIVLRPPRPPKKSEFCFGGLKITGGRGSPQWVIFFGEQRDFLSKHFA
jgi:hypothetical protein